MSTLTNPVQEGADVAAEVAADALPEAGENSNYTDEAVATSVWSEILATTATAARNIANGRKHKRNLGVLIARFRLSIAYKGGPDYGGDSQASRDAMGYVLDALCKGADKSEDRSERKHYQGAISRYAKLYLQDIVRAEAVARLVESNPDADVDAQKKAGATAIGKHWSPTEGKGKGASQTPNADANSADDKQAGMTARMQVVQAVESLGRIDILGQTDALLRLASALFVTLRDIGPEIPKRPQVQEYADRLVTVTQVIGKMAYNRQNAADVKRAEAAMSSALDGTAAETAETAETVAA